MTAAAELIDASTIVQAYDAAVSAGAVRFGTPGRGTAATLYAAQSLGLPSSTDVIEALRAARHPDAVAWDQARKGDTAGRRGRPRLDVPREPTGRPSRSAARAIASVAAARYAPTELIRVRETLRRDARRQGEAWLTQAGSDFLSEEISAGLFREAMRVFDIRARVDKAMGVKGLRAQDIQASPATPPDPDSDPGRRQAERDAAAMAAARQLRDDCAAIGPETYGAVLRYCVEGSASWTDRRTARLALEKFSQKAKKIA